MMSEKAIGTLITIGVMLYILSRFLNTKVGKHTISLSKKIINRLRGRKDKKKTKKITKENIKIDDLSEDAKVGLLALYEISGGDFNKEIPTKQLERYIKDNYERLIEKVRKGETNND